MLVTSKKFQKLIAQARQANRPPELPERYRKPFLAAYAAQRDAHFAEDHELQNQIHIVMRDSILAAGLEEITLMLPGNKSQVIRVKHGDDDEPLVWMPIEKVEGEGAKEEKEKERPKAKKPKKKGASLARKLRGRKRKKDKDIWDHAKDDED